MKCVLDACAAIALLRGEKGNAEILDLLEHPRTTPSIHALNLCEVYYDFLLAADPDTANQAIRTILAMGIYIHEGTRPTIWKFAGMLKAHYRRLSFADAIGVAYARSIGGIFVTSDQSELKPLANDKVCEFFFFR